MAPKVTVKAVQLATIEGRSLPKRLIIEDTVSIDDRVFFSIDVRNYRLIPFITRTHKDKNSRAAMKELLGNLKEAHTKASQKKEEGAAQELGIGHGAAKKRKKLAMADNIDIVDIDAPAIGSRESTYRMSVLPSIDCRENLWVELIGSNIEYLIDALGDEGGGDGEEQPDSDPGDEGDDA